MEERKVFHDSVSFIRDDLKTSSDMRLSRKEREAKEQKKQLEFVFATPSSVTEELTAAIAAKKRLSVDKMAQLLGLEKEAARLSKWLESEGFEITQVAADFSSVYACASDSQIEKTLHVSMIHVSKGKEDFTAADGPPSLPMDVGNRVDAIIGLQPYRQPHKHAVVAPSRKHDTHSNVMSRVSGYTPQQILRAYDASNLGWTGKGQTIGILIDTVPLDTDLVSFWREANVNQDLSRITKINVTGVVLPPVTAALESTLDTEWTSGIAPEANVRVYAAGSLRFVDLDRAIDQIIADTAKVPGFNQLSISLGLGEQLMVAAEVRTQSAKYQKLAALGVNVFVASGDGGSTPSAPAGNGKLQCEYASSDPNVIGVGGTSLKLDASGNVISETGWSGSGGGISQFFGRPSWQNAVGVSSNNRSVPDVSATADPSYPAFIYYNGQPSIVGGTSWATPIWAGLCALMNQARGAVGDAPLTFLAPLLYPLQETLSLRDITSGTNGAYSAKAGFDLVTGLGVPSTGRLTDSLLTPTFLNGKPINNIDKTFFPPDACEYLGKLYLFWKANDDSNHIFYSASADGRNWPSGSPINNSDATPGEVSCCVFLNKLYVFWRANDDSNHIFYSSFDGATWAASRTINDVDQTAWWPKACVFENKLYVFWAADDDSRHIFFSASSNGTTWSSGKTINDVDRAGASPCASVVDNELTVFWRAFDDSDQIFCSASSTGGSWPSGQPINSVDKTYYSPKPCTANGKSYLFWTAHDSSNHIFFSEREGTVWLNGATINNVDSAWWGLTSCSFNGKIFVGWRANDPSNKLFGSLSI